MLTAITGEVHLGVDSYYLGRRPYVFSSCYLAECNYVLTAIIEDAPDFVEVGEAGIAMDHAMRRQRRVQFVG